METKFTKAPEHWRAFESALQPGAWGIEDAIFNDLDPIIAPTRGLSAENAKALAHLKNSHAEMAAALTEILAHLHSGQTVETLQGAKWYMSGAQEIARAALAKARGQS